MLQKLCECISAVAAGFQDMCFSVPAQSPGADIVIVQAGKNAADDPALVLSPLNHGGCLLLFRLKRKG